MIALSNLAFPQDAPPAFLTGLARAGLAGIEVAPTRLGSWDSLTPAVVRGHRDALEGHGLRVPSLQALLFGAEGVALLGDAHAFDRMLDHLRRVAGIAAELGARVGVFGSPRQRSRGSLSPDAAFDLGTDRLRLLAEACWAEGGFVLGLEPVPAAYKGDFLTTAAEALAMVRAVDHPGLRLHLDTGCVLLGGGEIGPAVREGAPWLAHFHAAEPNLAPFAAPVADHAGAAVALRDCAYSGWISIEMLQAEDWMQAVPQAIAQVSRFYGAQAAGA